jgi:hypothetical protein
MMNYSVIYRGTEKKRKCKKKRKDGLPFQAVWRSRFLSTGYCVSRDIILSN